MDITVIGDAICSQYLILQTHLIISSIPLSKILVSFLLIKKLEYSKHQKFSKSYADQQITIPVFKLKKDYIQILYSKSYCSKKCWEGNFKKIKKY